MIFVTVSGWPFERLVEEMDNIAKRTKKKVIMQIGNTKYKPKYAEYFSFTSEKKLLECNKNADVIVSHAGAGCIATARQFGKPVVIVPRYKKFGEHVDDHQLELAHAMEKEGKAIIVYDIKDLEKSIEIAKNAKRPETSNQLVNFIKDYMKNMKRGKVCL
ncbi:MAG: beta-1,4-galactosyltransferase [Candidatus Aenigmarchaeota archaeon]|nr:beta-1,4-galactosyltransferase [Candidatus Aenigmarchaeota archaeon]